MRTKLLLLAGMGMCVLLGAQEKPVGPGPQKPELFLLLPEPREMRKAHSLVLGGARLTVFSPARQIAARPGIEVYPAAEFAKLGISADTFAKKAREAADRMLATLQPELKKDEAGRVRYAVYRGEEPVYACLLAAPSLAKIFEKIFGKEVWVAAPDRHALYVFPPNPAVVNDFAADLQDRFESDPFAASEEIFVLRADTGELKAVAAFTDR